MNDKPKFLYELEIFVGLAMNFIDCMADLDVHRRKFIKRWAPEEELDSVAG